ncbi:hypothetical protein LOTGIDRAFT_230307 [Lottia gigantea]|uniref:CHCH domain-containing protein n=1 Tax=Lottia gigantea TaxID=225164 RepID=V4BE75_LOTGI|nr:hypothetical protein LOTGIDRAFT_230307 [Lottia gigantea]ESP04062.1 hypothetical protein LOTGIDRAFT_230307 [Lottia gigantea]
MPKLTDTMCKAEKFTHYLPNTLKYKILLPPVLKNSVSTKKDLRSNKPVCVKEIAVLMACLKKEEFKNNTCVKEYLKFNECVEESTEELAKMREAQRKGLQIEGSNKFPAIQVNKTLRRFPQKPAVFELTKRQNPEHKKK